MHNWIHDQRTESLIRVSLQVDKHLETRRSSIHLMMFDDAGSCKEECLLRGVKIVQCSSFHLDLERMPAILCVMSPPFTSTNLHISQTFFSLSTNLLQSQHD